MKFLSNIREFLKGKKSYIIGFLMIAIGVYYSDRNLILEGFGIIALRAGIKKLEQSRY